MGTIVDSINVVNSLEEAPDRLRAEIGKYFSSVPTGPFSNFASFRSGIASERFEPLEPPADQLVVTKKSRIFISGREDQFRDQIQWNDYVNQTINTSAVHLDHQFSFNNPEIDNSLIKNHHDPVYENATKTYE